MSEKNLQDIIPDEIQEEKPKTRKSKKTENPEAKAPETEKFAEEAGMTALVAAILASSEPEEIQDNTDDEDDEYIERSPKSKAKKKAKEEDSGKSKEERLLALIEKGRKTGRLTPKEISDVVDNMAFSSEQMDKFYDTLAELNIDTMGDDLPALAEDEELPALDELE